MSPVAALASGEHTFAARMWMIVSRGYFIACSLVLARIVALAFGHG
jgi:hypothetical protein